MDTRVRDNLFAFFETVARAPRGTTGAVGSARWHHAPYANPMFSGVWGGTTIADVQGAVAALAERRPPMIFAWSAPGAAPDGLGEALVADGFSAWETDAPALAAPLGALDWSALERAPDGLRIERLADDRHLDAFARTFSAGLGLPGWAGESWSAYFRDVGVDGAIRPYLGFLDDEPVATNMLFCGGGVASVYGVATVPAARGRGIGGAITLAPYRDALAAGWREAVLFATDLGLPVYRRIGFADVDARISRWLRAG